MISSHSSALHWLIVSRIEESNAGINVLPKGAVAYAGLASQAGPLTIDRPSPRVDLGTATAVSLASTQRAEPSYVRGADKDRGCPGTAVSNSAHRRIR